MFMSCYVRSCHAFAIAGHRQVTFLVFILPLLGGYMARTCGLLCLRAHAPCYTASWVWVGLGEVGGRPTKSDKVLWQSLGF